jgi:hypothetical protein
VRFEASDRNELFSEIGRAPRVLVTLGRRGGAGLASYVPVVAEDVDVAVKRAIRFTETSNVWSGSVPSAPEDLEIGVTGYDLESIRDYEFGLPAGTVTALAVTVLDESTLQSLRVRAQVTAEITHDLHGEYLRVHAEGVVELGPVGQLLADRAVRSVGRFGRISERPSLPVPGFIIEVTDDSDFLLAKRTIRLDGRSRSRRRPVRPVRGRLPDQQPRLRGHTNPGRCAGSWTPQASDRSECHPPDADHLTGMGQATAWATSWPSTNA